jgi:quercetin dioxygenase-like cupin family protein
LEALFRNIKGVYHPDGMRARLLQLYDNPPTCTVGYSKKPPGDSSSQNIHPWEREILIILGSGTLFRDGKEYQVKAGEAMFIPPNTDHFTLNNGG